MNSLPKVGMTMLIATALIATPVTQAFAKQKIGITNTTNASTTVKIPWHTKLMINTTGKVNAMGTVGTVSGSTFTLNVWGGAWTVQTASTTKFSPDKATSTTLKSGDQVKIQGTISSMASTTITAKHITNLSFAKVMKESKKHDKEVRKDVKKELKELKGSIATAIKGLGTVLSVGSSTLQVKTGTTTSVTVEADTNTKIYNKSWLPISFSDIKIGHLIGAAGSTTSSTTLKAVLISDLSL